MRRVPAELATTGQQPFAQQLVDGLADWFEALLEQDAGAGARDRPRPEIQFDEDAPATPTVLIGEPEGGTEMMGTAHGPRPDEPPPPPPAVPPGCRRTSRPPRPTMKLRTAVLAPLP